jgi:CubicO group peptidase (beta-lactamase class C family)
MKVTKAEDVGVSTEKLEYIGQAMRRLIDENKIPGTVTLIARHGKVVHFETNGLRDVERNLPMEKDTIFRLYSQSKPVTGVAVMMLFEEGHFLLTDPISKYLPEFTDMEVYVGEGNTEPALPITIQQLLTHTSGLTYSFLPTTVGPMYAAEGIDASLGRDATEANPMFLQNTNKKPTNLQEWSEALAKLPLVCQPGSAWNYSVSMDVLGRLIEVISGKTFGEFLKERIFSPLGMVDTGFYVPSDKINRFAANYFPAEDGSMNLMDDPAKSNYGIVPDVESGGGGLVGTVGDYFKFAQMLSNKGEYEGKIYLGKKTVEFMMSNHLTPEFPDDPNGQRAWGIGFGLTGMVVTNPATAGLPMSKGTYGWGGAASTHFWVDHEEGMVGIVHTQLLPDGTYPIQQLMQLTAYQAIIE